MSRRSSQISNNCGPKRFLAAVLLLTLCSAFTARAEYTNPGANLELVPAGSLIIAMDEKQNIGSAFNLKAYGLANHLLHADIPLKWAIRAGKTKDGIDFTVTAQRVEPSSSGSSSLDFRGGPFIVHRDRAAEALVEIQVFGNNVAVYETTADKTVDVRFTLNQKKFVGVLDDGGNADIHTAVLEEAGFVANDQYEVIPAATLLTVNANSCYTMVSEPHWDVVPKKGPPINNDTEANAVRQFVQGGGNLLAQCAAIDAYENNAAYGFFQTDIGIVENNLKKFGRTYPNADLAFSQFVGDIADEGGSITDFELVSAFSNPNNGHAHVVNSTNSNLFIATGAKLTGGEGGNVLYLGGHKYDKQDLDSMNGKRMYMNAAMMPSSRPTSCGFDIEPPPAPSLVVVKTAQTLEDPFNGTTNPKAIPGALVEYTITVQNNGTAAAEQVRITDVISTGLDLVLGAYAGEDVEIDVGSGTSVTTCTLDDTDLDGDGCGAVGATLTIDPVLTVGTGGATNPAVIKFRATIN